MNSPVVEVAMLVIVVAIFGLPVLFLGIIEIIKAIRGDKE